jgi:hypothetical protein
MPRLHLRSFGAYAALAILISYLMAGLYCLLSVFSWPETIAVGALHVMVSCGARLSSFLLDRPLLRYMLFVLAGSMIGLVGWAAFKGPFYPSFVLVAVGNVAWSASAWVILTFVFWERLMACGQYEQRAAIRRGDVLIVLLLPIVVAAVAGAVYAMTNSDSVSVAERVKDFSMVVAIGGFSGLLLALPLSCCSLIFSRNDDRPYLELHHKRDSKKE